MQYKALLSDFDNTLVGVDAVINKPVKEAVQNLIASGYIFSLATGRPYYVKIDQICKELHLKHPIIVHGGARIINPTNGNIIWQESIKDEEVRGILNYFTQHNIYYAVEGDMSIYTPDGKSPPLYKDYTSKTLKDLRIHNIPKIVIPAKTARLPESRIDAIIDHLNSTYTDIHSVKFVHDGFFGMDITSEKGTKHVAALELMKILHLKAAEVVGAGDGYNDYPLLTACGTKTVMGDAPHTLKSIADFIAPTQAENGLATIIHKYFFDKSTILHARR